MSGGILGNGDPQGLGILGGFNQFATDNSAALLGLGAGLLSGDWGQGAQGFAQGMQQDERTRLIQRKQQEEEQKKVAAQQIAQKMGLPEGFASSPDDVFALARSVQAHKLTPKDPQLVGSAETGYAWLTPGQELPENIAKGTGPKTNWEIKTVKNADGSESAVYFNPRTMETRPVPGYGSGGAGGGNPYSTGKFTESEANAATYADRQAQSHDILNNYDKTQTSSWEVGKASVPFVGNQLASADYQQAEQAQRDFVNATLRRESGASISPAEFDNARKQYFPQPGDSDEVIEQKRQNRIAAIQGNMRSAGRGYRPPPGWEDPSKAGQKVPGPKESGEAATKGKVFKHRSGATVERLD